MIIYIYLFSWSLAGVFGVYEVKSVSVTEGESVRLNSDLTEIQREDEMTWKFNNTMIAKIYGKDNTIRVYEDTAEGRFRDRLKLDQTGSLIITNTRTTDSGIYEVTISSSSSRYTRHYTRSFRVTVSALPGQGLSPDVLESGLSSAAAKGIGVCVGAFLLGAAGVIYYRYKRSIGISITQQFSKESVRNNKQRKNRPNHALNGTQDTADRVNEETELTNAS